jgi:hypothetical protein
MPSIEGSINRMPQPIEQSASLIQNERTTPFPRQHTTRDNTTQHNSCRSWRWSRASTSWS